MYIVPDQYAETFKRIRDTSLSHSTCKVVIFVSCLDIDALCAAKIMAGLFKIEFIPHKIMPIAGQQELKQKFQDLDDEVVNVICLGCGATTDLESFFEIIEENDQSSRMIYVIDNHRPWNLDNLFASEKVICFDDGGINEKLAKHKEAYKILQELGEMEDDEEDGDTDEDTTPNTEGTVNDDDSDVIRSDNEDDDIYIKDNNTGKPGSPTETLNPMTERKTARKKLRSMHNESQEMLENYYNQGNFLNSSTAIQVYTLLTLIGETNVNFLWLAVVGVTSLDLQHSAIYTSLYPLIRDEVSRLESGSHSGQTNGNEIGVQLLIETDYLLFLLRHWSLYESMMNSSYLSGKLHLWTEEGRKKLHKMLAKMGISLQEARDQWTHMNVTLKRSLKDKLRTVAGMYGIDQVIRQGIVRRHGYKGLFSAGDCVDALSALLESGSDKEKLMKLSRVNGKTPYDTVQDDEHRNQFWVSNFWSAWDALDNVDLLMLGIHKAKLLQTAVVNASTALFEKRQIKDLRSFRLAVIRDGPDLEVFRNPLALARLGTWIAEACCESNAPPLPLVVASFNPSNESYLVLGMGPRKSRDVEMDSNLTVFNRFGPAFQATSRKINAEVTFDAFESSIIEVSKDDLSRFLESLTISGILEESI